MIINGVIAPCRHITRVRSDLREWRYSDEYKNCFLFYTHTTVGVFFYLNLWIKIHLALSFDCRVFTFVSTVTTPKPELQPFSSAHPALRLVWYQNKQFKVEQWSVSSLTLQPWFRLAVHFDSCYCEADAGEDSPARLLLLLSDYQSCLCWDTLWLKWWQWQILPRI